MDNDHPLAKIISSRMCTGCGTCIVACKKNALEMAINIKEGIYLPSIKKENCNDCGNCLEVCPALLFDNLKKNNTNTDDVNLLGEFKKCYVGYSTDHSVRENSSSGGLITELVKELLYEQEISGAILTGMNKERPLIAQPFIARGESDVLLAAGSKYCPVPVNTIFKGMKKDGFDSFAYVGLPCHIKGLQKLRGKYNYIDKKIKFCFGLVCNHTPTLKGLEFILKALSIDKQCVNNFRFRGKGWPGEMSIELKDGSKKAVPYSSELNWGFINAWFFWPLRCSVCKDKVCAQADISFMDAWHTKYRYDKIGTSLIIVRNEKADCFVREASRKGKIHIEELDPSLVIKSQKLEKYYNDVNKRRRYLVDNNREFMSIISGLDMDFGDDEYDIATIFFYLRNRLSNYKVSWPIINVLRYIAGMYLKLRK